MGRYATLAEQNWKANAPDQYRALRNPTTFFAGLEAEAQRQVDEAMDASPEPQDETFAQRKRRLQAVRQMAEEIVLRELLTPPAPEEPRSSSPEPETPVDRTLREALTDFQDARTEWQQTMPESPATTP